MSITRRPNLPDGASIHLASHPTTEWEPLGRVELGSIAVDQYSQVALVDDILHHALFGEETRQVVTANAQFYVLAQKSRRFRQCLRSADYICADGMPIVWACNSLYGHRIPRIAGVNLIEMLCRRGAAYGLRIFLLGGRPRAAEDTAEILKRRYPGIEIVGVSCPRWGFERREGTLREVLSQIAAADPDILFTGLGAPKQEFFINSYVRPLRVPLAIGTGGSFELLSGRIKRAPIWMQSSGLEWLFRLAQEPNRLWKRYLFGNAEFLWHFAKARFVGLSRPDELGLFGSSTESLM